MDQKESIGMGSKGNSREQLEMELRRRICGGFHRPGQRLPSERELASEFGVSRGTVQAVIESLVAAGLVIQRPNCRPIVTPRSEQSTPTSVLAPALSTIAVWIQPDLQDLGASMILQGIRSTTEVAGYRLQIGFPSTHRFDEEKRSQVQFLQALTTQPDVVGAIVWETCAPGFVSCYPALASLGIPVVFIDREPPEAIEADVIATNHRRGARKAVYHLLKLGHRRIGMVINDEPASSVRERVEGYRDALRAEGIPVKASMLMEVTSEELEAGPLAYTEKLQAFLAGECAPTAIFCVNDGIALGVQQALARLRIHVPEDISLIGFDWLLRCLPSGGDLTTVAQPFEAIGRIAAERLLERISGSKAEIVRHVLLEAPLVVKTTTGPPPCLLPERGKVRRTREKTQGIYPH